MWRLGGNTWFKLLILFALSSPATGQPVTPSIQFTWQASGTNDAHINISATDINFNSGGSTTYVTVDCIADDDGSFSFPAATQSELGSGYSTETYDVSRDVFSFVRQGNALLGVTSSSSD